MRATSNRIQTQNQGKFIQAESGFLNFWVLLQAAGDRTTSGTDKRGMREAMMPRHPLGRSRV